MQETPLKLKHFVVGQQSKHGVFVACPESRATLQLTAEEFKALQLIQQQAVSLESFLQHFLQDSSNFSYHDAVNLITKLYKHGFIALGQNTQVLEQLKFLHEAKDQASFSKKFLTQIKKFLSYDIAQLYWDKNTKVSSIHQAIFSPFAVAILTVVALLSGFLAFSQAMTFNFLDSISQYPDQALLQFLLSIYVSWNTLNLFYAAGLKALGAPYVQLYLRLHAGILPLLTLDPSSEMILSKRKALCFEAAQILLPLVMGSVIWASTTFSPQASTSHFWWMTMAAIVFLNLCPFRESPLIRLAQIQWGISHLLGPSIEYLTRHLLKGLFETKPQPSQDNSLTTSLNLWLPLYASLSILWLYIGFIIFFDLLLALTSHLTAHALQVEFSTRWLASVYTLAVLVSIVSLLALGLFYIMSRNIFQLTTLPLVRARKSLFEYKSSSLSLNELLINFLQSIPLFSQLDEKQIINLISHLNLNSYPKGMRIITEGELGHDFYIVADGYAGIYKKNLLGQEIYLGSLAPGDSFGEIALIKNVTRQASIVALTPVKTLSLNKAIFDQLFPHDSPMRKQLTHFINYCRLVQESKILSYLTPAEVGRFIQKAQVVHFKPGDVIIHQGDQANQAYVIAEGEAEVFSESHKYIASLHKGDIFGMIALLKNMNRTAHVMAKTSVTCLTISKKDLLEFCISNVLVGSLLSKLSHDQLEELQQKTQDAS